MFVSRCARLSEACALSWPAVRGVLASTCRQRKARRLPAGEQKEKKKKRARCKKGRVGGKSSGYPVQANCCNIYIDDDRAERNQMNEDPNSIRRERNAV